tara:strand:+ start:234 stop:683 length:450 start_codon:yes stop_codon:yes gene_type:complete
MTGVFFKVKESKMFWRVRAGLMAVAVIAVTACASVQEGRGVALEDRVDAYYEALIAKNFRAAYLFFPPGYREQFSFEAHYRNFPPVAAYESASVVRKECATETACRVTTKVSLVFMGDIKELKGVRTSTTLPERWVHTEGVWWILPPRS